MPGMNGESLARAVHDSLPRLPIVLVSGLLQDTRSLPGEEVGVRGVVSKPFVSADLAAKIRHVLDEHSPRRPAGER